MGKFDQSLRCCSSSNANKTLCRCFSSSVERKEFAALTMRAVAVCAIAAPREREARMDMRAVRLILINRYLNSGRADREAPRQTGGNRICLTYPLIRYGGFPVKLRIVIWAGESGASRRALLIPAGITRVLSIQAMRSSGYSSAPCPASQYRRALTSSVRFSRLACFAIWRTWHGCRHRRHWLFRAPRPEVRVTIPARATLARVK